MDKKEHQEFASLKEKYGKVMTAYLNDKEKTQPLTSEQRKDFYKLSLIKLADLPEDKKNRYEILAVLDWSYYEMLEKQNPISQIEQTRRSIKFRVDSNLHD